MAYSSDIRRISTMRGEKKLGSSSPGFDRPNLRIVLLGKSVSENSRVGNFLLGRAAFNSEAPPDVVERVRGRLKDRHVMVINSPQLLQTNISYHQITQTVRECVSLSNPGPHVFILVLQHNDFTEEDIRLVKSILREFSEEAIKRTIVITTDEETHNTKDASVQANEFIEQFNADCGGGHLQLEHETEECLSEISQQLEKILRENNEDCLTCELYDYAEETLEDEDLGIFFASLRTEEEEDSDSKDDEQHQDTHTEKKKKKSFVHNLSLIRPFWGAKQNQPTGGVSVTRQQKLNLVLCGSDETLKATVSKYIRGNKKNCVISLVELPALNRLSEEEVMRETLCCVSLCDPGVHVFLLIVPVVPLTDEDKTEMEEIQKIFSSRIKNHLMFLIIQEKRRISKINICQTSAIETFLQTFGGHHFVLENSSQVPALLQDVENMVQENKGSFYTTFMYLQDRVELERNKLTAEIEELRRSMMKTQSTPESQRQQSQSEELPKIDIREWSRTEKLTNSSKNQKLNLVLCGNDGSLMVSVSKLLRGKQIKSSHQRAIISKEIKEEKIHGRVVTLVELPSVHRLSEEEVMSETLRCVSLCDPGVHVFLLIVPAGTLTDGDKTDIEKILKILFYSREHLIVIFINEGNIDRPLTDSIKQSPESQQLISLCGGQYCVMGLKEPANSRQIPELLDYIENMKTEPYSLQMYVKAQENRARCETEEKYKEELKRMEDEIKELKQKIQSVGAEGEADDQKCLRTVLIGRTGNGKSATGNTILGSEEFHSQLNPDSVTTVCEKRVGEVDGRSIAVVDTPGLFDTTLSNDQVAEEIVKCVSMSSPGPHVFVIVLSLGRITKEETDTMDLIKKIFGHKSAQFSIVLFTRGDDLGNESIQQYVEKCKNAELKKLIRDCGNRFLAFNNREKQDKTQVIQLLKMIEEVKNTNEGRYFTNSMFEEAEMSIKKRMEEILKEREKEIQAQHEKIKADYESEKENMMKRLEEEKQRADEERKKMENQIREKEEKLRKEFEEKEKTEQNKKEIENQKQLKEEEQQKIEYQQKIEEMKREIKNQRSQYEKQQKEKEERDRKKEEKYRQDQENMKNEQERIIGELRMKQEEEIKKRELEEKKRNKEEEKERQEWERKIKEAENDRKEIKEEIKQKQREWEDEKKRQMREREEEERKKKEKHEEQLKEKQEDLEKMRNKFEREREEERKKIEEEREKQRREREEKEREYEEKKSEMERRNERLERERKEEWERRIREDDERREEERKKWKKNIEDLKQEQEEEIKRRETERKEREEKERDEMKQKYEEDIKFIKKKHEDEARTKAEETNELKERKEELQNKLKEHQKQHEILETLYKLLKRRKGDKKIENLHERLQDAEGDELKALEDEVEKLWKESNKSICVIL